MKKKNNKNFSNNFVTKKQIKQILNSRTNKVIKYKDTSTNLGAVTHSSADIEFPALGTGQSAIIGEKFRITKIDFTFTAIAQAISTCLPAVCRLIIYQVMTPTYGTSNVSLTGLLQDGSTPSLACRSPLDYENNKTLFKVLHDSNFKLNPFDNSTTTIKMSLKPVISEIMFDNATPTYNQGAIFVSMIIDNSNDTDWNSATLGYQANWTGRVWFTDV